VRGSTADQRQLVDVERGHDEEGDDEEADGADHHRVALTERDHARADPEATQAGDAQPGDADAVNPPTWQARTGARRTRTETGDAEGGHRSHLAAPTRSAGVITFGVPGSTIRPSKSHR